MAMNLGDPQATVKKPKPGINLGDPTGDGQDLGGDPNAGGMNIGDPQQPQTPLPPPVQPPAAPPAPPIAPQGPASTGGGEMTPAQAAAAGLGWVPSNHPLYGTPGFVGSAPGAPPGQPPTAPPAPPTAPPAPPLAPPGVTGDPMGPLTGQPPPPAPPSAPLTQPTPLDPNSQAVPYKDALLKMLGQAQTPATLEDPALKAQSDAAAVGLTRATDAGRAALAERMAQSGGAGVDSGAFNGELAGLFNQQGEQQASINAGLVGDANKQKVQQLQTALTMMGNDVNSEQGRALQKELASAQLAETSKEFEANYGLEGKRLAETIRQFDTSTQAGKDALAQQLLMFQQSQAQQGKQFDADAALKKLGIDTQASLGGGDLALRDKLGTGGLNAQILSMLMNNDQFGKSLGADLGKFNASQGNNYLSALLNQLGA